MLHTTVEPDLTPVERKFMDLKEHADDFFKIELLRPARSYYERALKLKPGDEWLKQRIAECDRMLKFERRVIWILVSLAAAIVLALSVF